MHWPHTQGAFSSRLERYLVEMYLKEKALFWGAAAAEQLMAQQQSSNESINTGAVVLCWGALPAACPQWFRVLHAGIMSVCQHCF